MTDYDFHTLNSGDFELLVRDLLNAEAKESAARWEFRSFPPGKDQGIDLVDEVSAPGQYGTVVQVKHYRNTPYTTLLNGLLTSTKNKRSEKDKVFQLKPQKFIVAISQKLTRKNKEEILQGFRPYMTSINDVIDNVELNRLLAKHPEVEEQHFKLWFSSRTVFERILHNDVHANSRQLAEEIQNKFKLLVITAYMHDAHEILNKQQFVIITGEPGVGKTSLAEMLLYFLAGQNYRMYWIEKSIAEVDALLKEDDSKQVFYFDDFLGHTKFEIESSKGQEKGLLAFIKKIKKYPNKFFILTTRTSLYTQAELESERFKNSDAINGKFKINVKELDLGTKILMIQNHLSVNHVPNDYRLSLEAAGKIKAIASHENFSPRLIEYVTRENNYRGVAPTQYYSYIIQQLKAPHEIWRHAYEQQINEYDRFLLTTLFSFGEATTQKFLESAFEKRMQYEIKNNSISRGDFYQSFKKLLGSFVILKAFHNGEKIDFINPSLEDFLQAYLSERESEKVRIIEPAYYVQQIFKRFRHAGDQQLSVHPGNFFFDRLRKDVFESVDFPSTISYENYVNIYLGFITWMFYKNKAGVEVSLFHFNKVNWLSKLDDINFYHLLGFIRVAHLEPEFNLFFRPYIENIARWLFSMDHDLQHSDKIIDLFPRYDLSFEKFMENGRNYNSVKDVIDSFFYDEISEEIDGLIDRATSTSDINAVKRDLDRRIRREYEKVVIYEEPDLTDFEKENWDAIFLNNQFVAEMNEDKSG
jgi:energy-coupling factor transporter ATP-binding protein EcfA2